MIDFVISLGCVGAGYLAGYRWGRTAGRRETVFRKVRIAAAPAEGCRPVIRNINYQRQDGTAFGRRVSSPREQNER